MKIILAAFTVLSLFTVQAMAEDLEKTVAEKLMQKKTYKAFFKEVLDGQKKMGNVMKCGKLSGTVDRGPGMFTGEVKCETTIDEETEVQKVAVLALSAESYSAEGYTIMSIGFVDEN